jgi:hypothetical protein
MTQNPLKYVLHTVLIGGIYMTLEQAKILQEALESMFDHISKNQSVMEELERIENLHREIASTAPPMLNHYLERRSYVKALDFIKHGFVVEDKDRPKCDH